jgi:hypothetical protein
MICLQTDGHGETSIPPYNFVAGGIIKDVSTNKNQTKLFLPLKGYGYGVS